MTVVPLHLPRRHKPAPLNHSAHYCPICWAHPLTEHAAWCNETTGPQPAYPAEARVFRGLRIGLPLGITGWVLFFAFLIWSH